MQELSGRTDHRVLPVVLAHRAQPAPLGLMPVGGSLEQEPWDLVLRGSAGVTAAVPWAVPRMRGGRLRSSS